MDLKMNKIFVSNDLEHVESVYKNEKYVENFKQKRNVVKR